MRPTDVKVGDEFVMTGSRYRVTDVGSRTVVAIRVDAVFTNRGVLDQATAAAEGWFNGPPYAVMEHVFDENALEVCAL